MATIHGSATWPDALRPVHRHNEGALELPIGWRSSTIAVALRQKEKDGDGYLDSEAGHSRARTLLNDIVIVLFVIDLAILVTPWI